MLTGQLQLRHKNTHVTVQDNIETTHLAIGAPVSTCVVLLNNGDTFLNQKSGLSNKLLTFCINKLLVWLLV